MPEAEETSTADLLSRLASDDPQVRRPACDAVAQRLRRDTSLVDPLNALLRDGTPLARYAAAYALFHGGRGSLRLLPPLLDALEFGDGDTRWSAAHLLTALGRMQGEVLPVLLHTAREAQSPRRRRMGLYAVRELAPERAEAEQCFVSALDDADPEVCRAALTSLAKLRDPGRNTLDRVIQTLESSTDPRMRRIAAVLLPDLVRHHADAADAAREALASAARDRDASLARAATIALSRLGEPGVAAPEPRA